MIFKFKKFLFIKSLLVFSLSIAYASPQHGQVVFGDAAIRQNSGNTSIVQQSDSAIINWDSFNIGINEHVEFMQPNSSSVVLNRVLENSPSEIYGRLSGNGRVFLINQSGILIGKEATIDTGSFLGSTANISDKDFIDGKYFFNGALSDVVNNGRIDVSTGGFAALLGKGVYNTGVISVGLGKVVMASGDRFLLELDNHGLVGIDITKAVSDGNILNSGYIEGHNILMSAYDASNMLMGAVNNTGVIKASSLREEGGKVILTGGSAEHSGLIDVSGENAGYVHLESSEYTAVKDGGTIYANGEKSSGSIKILSDGVSVFEKGAVAQARSIYGNGGLIEVSGKQVLTYGLADTRSTYGQSGTFLIDPTDIIIMKDAPENSLQGDFSPSNTSAISYIDMDYLNTQLAGNNVTISTVGTTGSGKGDITVAGGQGTDITGLALTLEAAGDIIIANERISLSDALNLQAAGSIVSSARLSSAAINAVSSNGIADISNIDSQAEVSVSASGNVSLGSVADINIKSASGKQVFIDSKGGIFGEGIVAGTVNMASENDINVSLTSSEITAKSNSGAITVNNQSNGTVLLDSLITYGKNINYSQSGGVVNLGNNINAESGLVGIYNKSGSIYADFNLISDTSRNFHLGANEIYLSKIDSEVANINDILTERLEASSLLDIKAVSDVIISNNISKPNIKLNIESAGGIVSSDGNSVKVSELTITALKDINVATDIEKGSVTSSEGDIAILEHDSAVFDVLSANLGKISLSAQNQGELKVNLFEARDISEIKSPDNMNIYLAGKNDYITLNLLNGNNSNIWIENYGNIDIQSFNSNGFNKLAVISHNSDITIPVNELEVTSLVALKGRSINNGSNLSVTAKNIILHTSGEGNFILTGENADISGNNLFVSLTDKISFKDLDNDGTAINTRYFEAESEHDIYVENRAVADFFQVKSKNFVLSSYNSSVISNEAYIRTLNSVYGTGRLVSDYLYIEGKNIGADSSILVDADNAVFRVFTEENSRDVTVAAPSLFQAIKSFLFITDGDAYINGVLINKYLYPLIKMSKNHYFSPYEGTNIGTGLAYFSDNEQIVKDGLIATPDSFSVKDAASYISGANGKFELK